MDATAWTVVGTAVVVLAAIGVSFWSLRDEMRAQRAEIRDLRDRVDASLSRSRVLWLTAASDGRSSVFRCNTLQ